jgi:hypothetical protein
MTRCYVRSMVRSLASFLLVMLIESYPSLWRALVTASLLSTIGCAVRMDPSDQVPRGAAEADVAAVYGAVISAETRPQPGAPILVAPLTHPPSSMTVARRRRQSRMHGAVRSTSTFPSATQRPAFRPHCHCRGHFTGCSPERGSLHEGATRKSHFPLSRCRGWGSTQLGLAPLCTAYMRVRAWSVAMPATCFCRSRTGSGG